MSKKLAYFCDRCGRFIRMAEGHPDIGAVDSHFVDGDYCSDCRQLIRPPESLSAYSNGSMPDSNLLL